MSILFLLMFMVVSPFALLVFLMSDAFKGFEVRCIYYCFVLAAIVGLALPATGFFFSLK